MTTETGKTLSKVPEVTFVFWLIKIAATTLGETGGDAVSMSMGLGYLLSTIIFAGFFIALVFWQIRAPKYHPFLYWATIIATTTVGTTMADFADRSLGIGYAGGSLLLLSLLTLSLILWHRVMGTISVNTVSTPKVEMFYWVTILFSQTLGTALGDWTADGSFFGYTPGYTGGMVIFGSALAILAALHVWTNASKVTLFWAAFILTRPMGAVLGDFLDKPVANGGLDLSRFSATAALLIFMIACILIFPSRAGEHPGGQAGD